MSQKRHHDVVVIGSGLAGLHAAGELEALGYDVQVLEAQQRSGGRIHSMRQLGSNAEAGGTFIGAGYLRVFAIAKRFGINLIDVTPLLEFFREQDLCLGTQIIRQSEWPSHPLNTFPETDRSIMPWNYHRVLTMRENPLPDPSAWLDSAYEKFDISMHDWMQSIGLSESAINLGYNINTSFGTDAKDVSALLLFFRAAFSKQQRQDAEKDSIGFTVENGVQRIPDAMAAALSREIEFEQVVTGIQQTANQLELTCANGRRYSADHVVIAVPPSALRNIAFNPALPADQLQAIHEVPSQAVTQVYLAAKTEFWENDGYSASLFTDSLPGMVAAVRDGNDPTRITHLTAWMMGRHAAALDNESDKVIAARVISEIERLRPAARGQLQCLGVQAWGKQPYAGGAWAYFRPGQVRKFAQKLGQAHGRIQFCGEHLGPTTRGMEGALEAAEAVVATIAAM